MDTPSGFIAQLRSVRENLSDAVRTADAFEYKLLGPRPSDTKGENPKPAECVGSLLSEIHRLSEILLKTTNRHHEIFGEFGGEQCAANTSRYA